MKSLGNGRNEFRRISKCFERLRNSSKAPEIVKNGIENLQITLKPKITTTETKVIYYGMKRSQEFQKYLKLIYVPKSYLEDLKKIWICLRNNTFTYIRFRITRVMAQLIP